MITELAHFGANIKEKNEQDETPLELAYKNSNEEICYILSRLERFFTFTRAMKNETKKPNQTNENSKERRQSEIENSALVSSVLCQTGEIEAQSELKNVQKSIHGPEVNVSIKDNNNSVMLANSFFNKSMFSGNPTGFTGKVGWLIRTVHSAI